MEGADTATVVIHSGLPQAGNVSQPVLSRFVLRKAGERFPGDQTKIYVPVDAQGASLGVAIVRYATDAAAQRAIDRLEGTAIDVNHTWSAERTATSQMFTTMSAQGQINANRLTALHTIEEGRPGQP